MSTDNANRGEAIGRFRIGALLYFRDGEGRLLLMKRKRPPNRGLWCAVGGKLEMSSGESPYECAAREAAEEVGAQLSTSDLALRSILSEKDYQGTGHWLMFIFQVVPPLAALPAESEEGEFAFFEEAELATVAIPELDRQILVERVLPESETLHILRSDGDGEPLVEESRVSG